ncbi:hypothetical protein [Mycolicibacterium fluoranthenivorans]|uniref:Uncharacterized protein n=1 Tax=Mycolicibacterium fluoranthenivorans TaxID=258505 RepID=A0A7X5U5R1_9MYCO|nr:hypothetical protein [Mycolicibacterium fluoranthenivorans]MCV7354494.1 hypothetical protein [Mycolicibacterium fluoranthenivorans]NIH98901.1 hypothetical protein [Mycolicibacterium fluoranthenivorans]
MDINFQTPNPGLAAFLLSGDCRRAVEERANMAMLLYQARVAKRTGALARSAHASTEIGGVRHDRHIGVMTVGRGVDYELPHEFGRGNHPGSVHDLDSDHETIQQGADDLNAVLEELSAY